MNRLFLMLIACLAAIPSAFAQNAPVHTDLLRLLPDDFAVCVVVHDLRGHASRWEQSDWLKCFRQSPVGKNLLNGPEIKQLEHLQNELKKHLDIDWPTLRDDILGDTLVLSYSPGPKTKPDDEQGLILLHVRQPDRLQRFIDKLNDAQKSSGELKSLTELHHKGNTYFCRAQREKSQYYFLKDSLAVFTVKEERMQSVLDRRASNVKESPWEKRFAKAGVEKAFATMCVNPRMLDAEVLPKSRKNDPLPSYWRALDAIFVTLSIHDDAELRIAIQADAGRLPKWASPAFTDTMPTSTLWQRFPETSILTIASQTDFAGAVDAIKLLMPEKDRKKLASDWLGNVQAYLQLDLFKDLMPNIGPDWGVCVLPSKDATQVPMMMFTLAVKPGAKEPPVDQMLFKAIERSASGLLLLHNGGNPKSIIRLQTVKQGNVEVKYLANDKLFPPGFQPACALKDGFLIFATTPDAIADFKMRPTNAAEPKESMVVRVSAPELAKLLDHRRDHIVSTLTQDQKMSKQQATQNLENVISILGLFDRMTLSQQGEAGQTSWIIRVSPKKK